MCLANGGQCTQAPSSCELLNATHVKNDAHAITQHDEQVVHHGLS
jgi:hypothetical protein